MSFWETGNYIRSFGMALPKGEHKLSWRWVKDYSVSEGADRATLHQLVVTGLGEGDNTCTPCAAGTCGNQGIEACPVCSPATRSPSAGATSCVACEVAPDSAHHVGPHDWPGAGSTDACGWECNEGYCSQDGSPRCPAGLPCPPGMCCASNAGCFIPTVEAVRNGLSPATLQMLQSCLTLIPVDAGAASQTLNVAARLLGPNGAWKSRGEAYPPRSAKPTSTKGQAMDDALAKVP